MVFHVDFTVPEAKRLPAIAMIYPPSDATVRGKINLPGIIYPQLPSTEGRSKIAGTE
jgi:hypothetical protein